MDKFVSRRDFLKILGMSAAGSVLAACTPGPAPINAENSTSSPTEPQVETCVDAYPGASITQILENNGLPAGTEVRVLAGDGNAEIYKGAGVNGPALQLNTEKGIQDEVCFDK